MGGVAGAMAGVTASQNQLQAAQDARNQALAQYLGISTPGVAQQSLNLQQYGNAGNLNNQLEQAMQLGPSAMTQVAVDPRLAQAQMAALQQLSTVGQMGMTPAEQAALTQAQNNAAAQAQAKNQQIVNQFAAQGMGGSGAQLAAQLSNSQNAAQMLANNSNQTAQNAQQNALQAISQAGGLAGNISGQQFGQQAAIAQAKDYINQFNLQNAQNVSNTNVGLQNQAGLYNLQNAQNLSNMNTQLQNQQQQYNKQLLQQQFNNQMALASGRAGQYQGIAQAAQTNAANVANQYAGIGQGIDTGIGAAYNAYNNSGNNSYGSNFEDYGTEGQSSGGYSPGYGSGLTEEEMAGGQSPSDMASSGADEDIADASELVGGGY